MSKMKGLIAEIDLEPPSLEAMIKTHGGWGNVPDEAWKRFLFDRNAWMDRVSLGEIWRRKNWK